MPSFFSVATERRPAGVSGTLTTTFSASAASLRPWARISSYSVASTSPETGPGTSLAIACTVGRYGLPALAISEGLVVMPSTMPHSRPVSISLISAVSRKNCMGSASLVHGLVRPAVVVIEIRLFEDLQLAGVLGRLQLKLGRRRAAVVLGELDFGLLVRLGELGDGDDTVFGIKIHQPHALGLAARHLPNT